jgi:hypothetical protein
VIDPVFELSYSQLPARRLLQFEATSSQEIDTRIEFATSNLGISVSIEIKNQAAHGDQLRYKEISNFRNSLSKLPLNGVERECRFTHSKDPTQRIRKDREPAGLATSHPASLSCGGLFRSTGIAGRWPTAERHSPPITAK